MCSGYHPHHSFFYCKDTEWEVFLPRAKSLFVDQSKAKLTWLLSSEAKIIVSSFLALRHRRTKLAKCDIALPNAVLEQLSVFLFPFLSSTCQLNINDIFAPWFWKWDEMMLAVSAFFCLISLLNHYSFITQSLKKWGKEEVLLPLLWLLN